MKSIILVALAFVAIAAAAPTDVKILQNTYEREPEGQYESRFETDDGTSRVESGVLKEHLDADNKPAKFLEVRGSFSYIKPDGTQEVVTYVANENGFQAEGPSIPKN